MDNNLTFKYLQAATNLYGIVPPEKIVEIYNRQNEDNIKPRDLEKYSEKPYDSFQYFSGYFVHNALKRN